MVHNQYALRNLLNSNYHNVIGYIPGEGVQMGLGKNVIIVNC